MSGGLTCTCALWGPGRPGSSGRRSSRVGSARGSQARLGRRRRGAGSTLGRATVATTARARPRRSPSRRRVRRSSSAHPDTRGWSPIRDDRIGATSRTSGCSRIHAQHRNSRRRSPPGTLRSRSSSRGPTASGGTRHGFTGTRRRPIARDRVLKHDHQPIARHRSSPPSGALRHSRKAANKAPATMTMTVKRHRRAEPTQARTGWSRTECGGRRRSRAHRRRTACSTAGQSMAPNRIRGRRRGRHRWRQTHLLTRYSPLSVRNESRPSCDDFPAAGLPVSGGEPQRIPHRRPRSSSCRYHDSGREGIRRERKVGYVRQFARRRR